MTDENISLFNAIYSQRAIRHFSENSVSDETIEAILSAIADGAARQGSGILATIFATVR